MARRKRASAEQPIGVGLTAKQMKRKKPLNQEYLVDIEPLSENQKRLFDSYKGGKQIVAYGCAGTGKTFTLENRIVYMIQKYEVEPKNILIRSLLIMGTPVKFKEIGFLPRI